MPAPKPAAPLTQTVHHDVYQAISPTGALAGAAEGLTVVITGAGRGIGRAHALAFAQAGAQRIVIGARSMHELDEVAEAIAALSGQTEVLKVELNVTNEESVDALFKQVPDVNGALRACLPRHAH
jgi:NAD(P)-dependent dehydrogenase (short-subunit alcohol dehydrogenase family)